MPNAGSARNSRRGIALPMMAILFAVLLAFMGLVLDGGHIYFQKRRMQFAADAGSYAGAQEVMRRNTGLVQSSRSKPTAFQAVSFERVFRTIGGWQSIGMGRTRSTTSSIT